MLTAVTGIKWGDEGKGRDRTAFRGNRPSLDFL